MLVTVVGSKSYMTQPKVSWDCRNCLNKKFQQASFVVAESPFVAGMVFQLLYQFCIEIIFVLVLACMMSGVGT